MKILDLIRERLTTRHGDARSKYWATVGKIANGDMSERAAAAAADTLEALLPAMGKTIDDVQRDIDTLTEMRATEVVAAQHAQARIRAKGAARTGVEVEAKAVEFEARAKAMRAEHAAEVHAARATMQAGDGAESRLAELRNRLAAAGFPDAVAAVERAKCQREVDRVEVDLRVVERDLAEAEGSAATFTGNEDHAEARAGRRVAGAVAALRQKRDALRQKLVEIRNGELATRANTVAPARDGLDVEVLP